MTLKATIELVTSVTPHPNSDKMSLVEVAGHTLVSTNLDDGMPRYTAGAFVVYTPENAILPDFLLKEGYWDEEKGKGILGGNKGNRVKNRKILDVVSDGLIFPVVYGESLHCADYSVAGVPVVGPDTFAGLPHEDDMPGTDVTELLGITEYVPQV